MLEEAQNRNNPLLERVKFLSISASNLDEFYMVRVAGLMDQLDHGIHTPSADGLPPKKQLEQIRHAAGRLIEAQQKCWLSLKKTLRRSASRSSPAKELSPKDKAWLKEYFSTDIFSAAHPRSRSTRRTPFPFIPNLGLVQVMELIRPKKSAKRMVALIPFPTLAAALRAHRLGQGRALRAAGGTPSPCASSSFSPASGSRPPVCSASLRDSDLDIEEEAEDLITQQWTWR
ncbi:MAG: hypothetical protein WDN72_00600 [Alphaproteobacteria bacterium]